ncbi:MAG: hypothetical protein AAF479_04375 [Pseudomonadota bacterium]
MYESDTTIIEQADEGYDLVYARVDVTLSEHVEFGAANGPGNIDIEGNASANQIIGNADSNVLSGLGGNDRLRGLDGVDTIDGGTGSDVLEGGSDADHFVFETGDGTDLILDFEVGTDVIDLTATGAQFADLTIVQSSLDVLVLYGSDVIRVANTTVAELDSAQFEFA